jgi:hypothetical protein
MMRAKAWSNLGIDFAAPLSTIAQPDDMLLCVLLHRRIKGPADAFA